MPELTLQLGTITPLFMGSADPNIPELRATSVKGMLRFWWRAANANLSDLADLKKREGLVFGDTKQRSCIMLTVEKVTFSHINKVIYAFRNHHGLKYLWHFLNASPNEGKQALLGKFKIKISTRGNSIQEKQAFKQASGALWLAIHLGGLGNRARRGSGAISVLEANGDESDLDFALCNKDNWSDNFSSHINKAEKLVCTEVKNLSVYTKKYSHLHGASIFMSTRSTGVYEALNTFGNLWKNYRGTPNRKNVTKKKAEKFGHSNNNKRQASPIFVTANGNEKSSRLCITILNNKHFEHDVYKEFIDELECLGLQRINHILQTTP